MRAKRNETRDHKIAFVINRDQQNAYEAKAAVSGMEKGEFVISAVLDKPINLKAGMYLSDRFSVAIHELRQQMKNTKAETEDRVDALKRCYTFLREYSLATGRMIESEDSMNDSSVVK